MEVGPIQHKLMYLYRPQTSDLTVPTTLNSHTHLYVEYGCYGIMGTAYNGI